MASLKIALAAALLWPAAATADPVDRWSSEIASASVRFDIPEAWIRRVMRAESGGETLLNGRPIVSRTGAMGLMQLMPGTWHDMRLALGLGTDPHDPADNILAGTFYLRLMYDRFGYPGLFAAYNAGPGRYAEVLSGRRSLPLETRHYILDVQSPRAAAPRLQPPRRGLFAVPADNHPPLVSASSVAAARPSGLFIQLSRAADR